MKRKRFLSLAMAMVVLLSLFGGMQTAGAASVESDFNFDSTAGTITGYKGSEGAAGLYSATISPTTSGSIAIDVTLDMVTGAGVTWIPAAKTVNLNIVPDTGMQLKAGSLKFNDTAITGTSFIMPAENVTINAEFETTNFVFDSSAGTITKYTGAGGAVEIPSAINNVKVTAIGAKAFYGCTTITGVTISQGVKSIGDSAFEQCSAIMDITIPDGVESLGKYAFNGCRSLKSVTLPNSITNMGISIFYGCTSLISVNIPTGITGIPDYTFISCEDLTKINIPTNITSIGKNAFVGCLSLESIVIPASVTTIGDKAFVGLNYLPPIYTALSRAVFLGDAPAMGTEVFSLVDDDFMILYPSTAASYGSGSTWNGYPIQSYDPLATYAVTYDANSGTGTAPAAVTGRKIGDSVTVAGNSFTRENYEFKCWNTAADGSGTIYYAGDELLVSAENVTLYAIWNRVYKIIVESTSHGSITTNVAQAKQYGYVEVTFAPDAGWVLQDNSLKYNDGTGDHLIGGGGGYSVSSYTTAAAKVEGIPLSIKMGSDYYFLMPAADVTVLGIFVTSGSAITTAAISGVTVPVKGATPVTTIPETPTYTAAIFWSPADATFAAGTTYTATISITPKTGYTLTSITKNFFTAAGATTANDADSGIVTVVFPKTAADTNSDSGDSSSDDSNSNSNNNSTNNNTNTTPAEVTMPPASTTSVPIVTAPPAGNGVPSVTGITPVDAKDDGKGKATAEVTKGQVTDALNKALAEAAQKGGDTEVKVEIKVTAPVGAKSVETDIPRTEVDAVAGSKATGLTISTPLAALTFDESSLDTISKASGDVKISVAKADTASLSNDVKKKVGDRPVYDFSVNSGDKTISKFGGSVSVSVPYTPKTGEDPNAIVIYYINADGKLETVSDCHYDPATGTISFKTNHFSQYAVGYNKISFKDISSNAWYNAAVTFVAARGITTGTGDGSFSPEAKLTRGQFLVMLMRAYGIEADASPKNNFSDAGNTYYTGYLAAAKRLGITSVVGDNKFAPDQVITRQEMFTLLYKTLKAVGKLPEGTAGKKLADFGDVDKIASWAKEPIKMFVEAGIISGSNNRLLPLDTAGRAEMAQILYKLLSQQ